MTRLDRCAIAFVLFCLFSAITNHFPSFNDDDPSVGRRPLPEESEPPLPTPPEPAPDRIGRPIPNADPDDPLFSVDVEGIPADMMEIGTSFPVSNGVWLTARHVANGACSQLILIVNDKKISANINYLHPDADLAVVRTRATADTNLQVSRDPLTEGETGFSFGYPQGKLGATQDRVMGRARMKLAGRLSGVGPVVAWAEMTRYPADLDSIQGMSGGPMFDASGNVIGIIVATSVRRGRNYSVAPEIIRQTFETLPALAVVPRAEAVPEIAGQSVSLDDVVHALAANSRIAKTYCLPTN